MLSHAEVDNIKSAFGRLGITPTTDKDLINRAYRKAAKFCHPDQFRTESEKWKAQLDFIALGKARDRVLEAIQDPHLLNFLSAKSQTQSRTNYRGQANYQRSQTPPQETKRTAEPNSKAQPKEGKAHQTQEPITLAEARRLLIDLREKVIKRNHPDVDWSRGILRKTILEAVLRHLPTTHAEWNNCIPELVRSNIDTKQMVYLNQIFAIAVKVKVHITV